MTEKKPSKQKIEFDCDILTNFWEEEDEFDKTLREMLSKVPKKVKPPKEDPNNIRKPLEAISSERENIRGRTTKDNKKKIEVIEFQRKIPNKNGSKLEDSPCKKRPLEITGDKDLEKQKKYYEELDKFVLEETSVVEKKREKTK